MRATLFVEPVEGRLWDWMKITKYPSSGDEDKSSEHATLEKSKASDRLNRMS